MTIKEMARQAAARAQAEIAGPGMLDPNNRYAVADAVAVALLQHQMAHIPGDDGREFIQSYLDLFQAPAPVTPSPEPACPVTGRAILPCEPVTPEPPPALLPEKPPFSAHECAHGHDGGCSKCDDATVRIEAHLEKQECAEEVIYAAVNFLRGYVWDKETESLALRLERVALDIENGIRPITKACERYRELAGPFERGRCDKCGLPEAAHSASEARPTTEDGVSAPPPIDQDWQVSPAFGPDYDPRQFTGGVESIERKGSMLVFTFGAGGQICVNHGVTYVSPERH